MARSAACSPTPWFAPIAATSRLGEGGRRLLRGHPAQRLGVLVEGHDGDDGEGRDVANRLHRGDELVELVEGLDHEQVDAAALEQPRLFREHRAALFHPAVDLSEGADRAGDEDVSAGDLARVTGDLHRGFVDLRDVLLEEVLGELVPVRAEGVGLDQVGAGADEAEMEREHALGRAQVRLLGAAQPRDGARDEDAHAPVADDRQARFEPLQEAVGHARHSRRPIGARWPRFSSPLRILPIAVATPDWGLTAIRTRLERRERGGGRRRPFSLRSPGSASADPGREDP